MTFDEIFSATAHTLAALLGAAGFLWLAFVLFGALPLWMFFIIFPVVLLLAAMYVLPAITVISACTGLLVASLVVIVQAVRRYRCSHKSRVS